MYKVKLTPYRAELGAIYDRQTPGRSMTSRDGRYRFYIGEDCPEPDFWVVQGKGVRSPQTCRVSPKNTVFLATEPASVLVYPQKYLRQFGMVCTCQEPTHHPSVVYGPAVLPWFVGFSEDADGTCRTRFDYDQLAAMGRPEKTKLLSVITSNKAFTQGHLDRIEFVSRLKQHYGDKIDVFGRGFRTFDDKWDVLAPYRYHIAIENSSQRYYWTEKLSDCYLAGTFPLYYGCTNVADYFPDGSFATIDLNDFDKTVSIIDRLLQQTPPEAPLREARRLVLDRYNLFETIASLCDRLDASEPKQDVTISPCRSADDWHNLYNYTVARNFFKMKRTVLGWMGKGGALNSQQ